MKLSPAISILLAATAALSCSTDEKGKAVFDYFEYAGNDTFYLEHPLPDKSWVYNPILPGWYSDPSICTNGEGDYFLATSTFVYYPGVPLFHSRDLVNWKQIGNVLTSEAQMAGMEGQGVSGGIFAPDIKYNPANKTYYMTTINVGTGNFFVKTTDPWGEWSEPIALPEVHGIDPSFFFDEDGRAYIVNNDDAPDGKPEYDGHRTIRIREFDTATDKVCGEEIILLNKGVRPEEKPIWIEGPHIYKINGKYFLMAAEGGTSVEHSEVILRADSPMGPYTPWKGNPILTQRHLDANRDNPVTCAGHADLVQTPEGDWWAVFLACRPTHDDHENLGRETFLMPVRWSQDGFPYLTEGEQTVPPIVKVNGATRGESVTFGNFRVRDEFDSDKLGLEWMTLRSGAEHLYSLDEKKGSLTLNCSPVKASDKSTPALIARRLQHHSFRASTGMSFDGGGSAGMILFKDETHHYSFLSDGENLSVLKEDTLLASVNTGPYKQLDLIISSDGRQFQFSYKLDGNQETVLLNNVSAEHLSTKTAGGFTGTTIGIYATD